ncbi:ATP-binding cassette domain-containing protein [Microbacterium sp. 18062]|uniref:ATP-binding cassette domain-containing protein n=1 Tax=Microbacterium sp. 18062 TaxID=2681410 RepID=UPI00135B0566|nr:ATP-binding cassette domain-containing protein [Microbacterium sp. 18062]
MALLQLTDVEKTFGSGDRRTVAANRVTMAVGEGEIVGLVGESGSGKSTIANLVLGLQKPDSGTVSFAGRDVQDWLRRDQRGLRRQVQAVFQQPLLALDSRRVIGWSVAEPLVIHRIGDVDTRRARVLELLDHVGLSPEIAERLPHQLSGGQLQRVNIARALALEPRLLVCDEAVSALDVSVQAQVLNLLLELQERLGIAMLFISHDIAVVRHISDSMVVMYRGDIVERGDTDQVCGNPRSEHARVLIEASS